MFVLHLALILLSWAFAGSSAISGLAAKSNLADKLNLSSEKLIVVSEVMANPQGVSDERGEFIELASISSDPISLDTLHLKIENSEFKIPRVYFRSEGRFLLCRDSLSSENGGMHCDRQLSNLSLSNSRSLTIVLGTGSDTAEYTLPISVAGKSWENTLAQDQAFQHFELSSAKWNGVDLATPGFQNSCSKQIPNFDLGIMGISNGKNNVWSVEVKNLGRQNIVHAKLSIRVDQDGDGIAEKYLDSLFVKDGLAGGGAVIYGREGIEDNEIIKSGESVSCLIPDKILSEIGKEDWIELQLSIDDNFANNSYRFRLNPNPPLQVIEFCAAPDSGAPEWVEIQNRNPFLNPLGIGNGSDNSISLNAFTLNHIPLKLIAAANKISGDQKGSINLNPIKIMAGENIVLTANLEEFKKRQGSMKVTAYELSTWPTLHNGGDTMVLALAGLTVDSLIYSAADLKMHGGCLVRTLGDPTNPSSQGALATKVLKKEFTGIGMETVPEFTWTFSSQVAGNGKNIEVTVFDPDDHPYLLRLFDLEGRVIKDLGRGSMGKTVFIWEGLNEGGRPLPTGAYVLALISNGHRVRKQVVIVDGLH